MKNKVVLIGAEARAALVKGADFMADAVRSTLGPHGANAAIEKNNMVTNDGVTIAREICSGGIADEIEARGARMMLEAATKTDSVAGDGTTTAITLAQAIVKEAMKDLGTTKTIGSRKAPAEIISSMETERADVEAKLISMAETVTTKEQLIQSALVSVEDKRLADLIGTAQWELGKEGMLMAEETNEPVSSVERVPGIRVDNGFTTSLAINNQEKQSLDVKNVPILLTNYTFTNLVPLMSVLDRMYKQGVRALVLVGRAFTEEAIQLCQENARNNFLIYPINAPYTDQSEIMRDLQAVLGGRFVNNEETALSSVTEDDFGFATSISAKRFQADFVGKESTESRNRVMERIDLLKTKMSGEVSDFEKKNLEARIAQLSSGFAVIKVGATSELQRKYLKLKADDAVNAVRAALQEGVVSGAGQAFKTIAESLPDTAILKRPLCSLYNQIISSSPVGFVIEPWVKDPVKVLRIALEQACSVAATFATSSIAIATEKQKPLDILLRRAVANTEESEV